jgi:hypothetical protein
MARRKSHSPRHASAVKKTFKAAVQATPMIASAFCPGVQALKREHRQGLRNAQIATGSIDLDATLEPHFHNDHRWDYGIGLAQDARTEKVLWLEVHHAASGETERVINKLKALKAWLQSSAPELDRMPKKFVWQLSNVERNPNDRRSRNKLAEAGGIHLRVQGALDLATL